MEAIAMTTLDLIQAKLIQLDESNLQQIYAFIENLSQPSFKSDPTTISNRRGGLGAWKGKIKMSADFEAPLADLQDYM
jgi:hypothetical protein